MPRKLRSREIDLQSCRVFHIVSRCVRSLHLMGIRESASDDRHNVNCDNQGATDTGEACKALCLRELGRLAQTMAIEIAGFAIMDNHIHLLLHVDVEKARAWSPHEVAQRWLHLHPARNGYFQPIETSADQLNLLATDDQWIEQTRAKLYCVSQFMKEFKQEVAQQANKLHDATGAFWEGRYKLKAVRDEAQLLATLCYIDLNPFAAGACDKPRQGKHTSLAARLGRDADHAYEADIANSTSPTSSPRHTTASAKTAATPPARIHRWRNKPASPRRWLTPLGTRRGLFAGLTQTRYLRLLDQTARLMRPGRRRQRDDGQPITRRTTITPVGLAAHVTSLFESWSQACPGLVSVPA